MVTHCFMLYALLASSVARADYLDDRIARVFPFEVGQEYEFQSALDFHRPNGEILPAFTVANVTVTDTVINDTTWLHIPYWSPWGTEYYRLDDSMRVISYDPDDGSTWQLLTVDIDRWIYSLLPGDPYWPEEPSQWAYFYRLAEELDSSVVQSFQFYLSWESAPVVGSSDSILAHSLYYGVTDVDPYRERYGRFGNGSSEHIADGFTGFFRSVSDEPWPELSGDFLTDIQQATTQPAQFSINTAPNPFNPDVAITLAAPDAARYCVSVYDVRGALVDVIADRHFGPGTHRFVWNASEAGVGTVGSGIYFVRAVDVEGGRSAAARITLVR